MSQEVELRNGNLSFYFTLKNKGVGACRERMKGKGHAHPLTHRHPHTQIDSHIHPRGSRLRPRAGTGPAGPDRTGRDQNFTGWPCYSNRPETGRTGPDR